MDIGLARRIPLGALTFDATSPISARRQHKDQNTQYARPEPKPQQLKHLSASTMFNFTPLLGALSSSPASQSLLEFDGGIKVLIDVGWDESFDISTLKEIER
jgi:hypothetical protein